MHRKKSINHELFFLKSVIAVRAKIKGSLLVSVLLNVYMLTFNVPRMGSHLLCFSGLEKRNSSIGRQIGEIYPNPLVNTFHKSQKYSLTNLHGNTLYEPFVHIFLSISSFIYFVMTYNDSSLIPLHILKMFDEVFFRYFRSLLFVQGKVWVSVQLLCVRFEHWSCRPSEGHPIVTQARAVLSHLFVEFGSYFYFRSSDVGIRRLWYAPLEDFFYSSHKVYVRAWLGHREDGLQ